MTFAIVSTRAAAAVVVIYRFHVMYTRCHDMRLANHLITCHIYVFHSSFFYYFQSLHTERCWAGYTHHNIEIREAIFVHCFCADFGMYDGVVCRVELILSAEMTKIAVKLLSMSTTESRSNVCVCVKTHKKLFGSTEEKKTSLLNGKMYVRRGGRNFRQRRHDSDSQCTSAVVKIHKIFFSLHVPCVLVGRAFFHSILCSQFHRRSCSCVKCVCVLKCVHILYIKMGKMLEGNQIILRW